MLNHENFGERLIGKFFLPISRHINGAGAENSADHQPQHDVGDFFAGNFFATRAERGRPKSDKNASAIITPYQWIGERTKMKQQSDARRKIKAWRRKWRIEIHERSIVIRGHGGIGFRRHGQHKTHGQRRPFGDVCDEIAPRLAFGG